MRHVIQLLNLVLESKIRGQKSKTGGGYVYGLRSATKVTWFRDKRGSEGVGEESEV